MSLATRNRLLPSSITLEEAQNKIDLHLSLFIPLCTEIVKGETASLCKHLAVYVDSGGIYYELVTWNYSEDPEAMYWGLGDKPVEVRIDNLEEAINRYNAVKAP